MQNLEIEQDHSMDDINQIQSNGEAGEHMKAMWAGQSNVLVALRVRPLLKHDITKKSCVRVLDNKVVCIMDPASGDKQDILRVNRSREKQYAFDYVFEPGSSQISVYQHTTKFLIHGVLDGYNATVFCYGNTGAGKTFTMIGTPSEPGIMVRVMEDLFIHSAVQGKQHGVIYKVTVSFLEVYNENIRDLLSDAEEYLDLREDPIKGPIVAGITEYEAKTSQEIMNLLHRGNEKRSQQATAANEVSSRSHAVLQVIVENKDRAPGKVAKIKVGKLSLVDLAGSERAANTKNRGARLVEGANINRSLLALGNCINALGEKGNKGNFVPYRDSKLTRLLKDSLGGNCRTVMIANISSSESSFEETLNTLKYANRAKNIKTNIQRNELDVNYHISEYVQLIDNLRSEIKGLKDQIASADAHISPTTATAAVPSQQPITPHRVQKSTTPLDQLRETLRSGSLLAQNNIAGGGGGVGGIIATSSGEGKELLMGMRQNIVDNFQERMQLRRSLIELEDQIVQNSIEVSKRQLLVVQWWESHGMRESSTPSKLGNGGGGGGGGSGQKLPHVDFATAVSHAPAEIKEAWVECEQLKKANLKNNGIKKTIGKRLRYNEKEAERFRSELSDKITGEDKRELMELQYQVGRLELENMELEQHRIVHESILKGKDLTIQKLKLQLAVKDKLIQRQNNILVANGLEAYVGYSQFTALEQTLTNSDDAPYSMPPSPPKSMMELRGIAMSGGGPQFAFATPGDVDSGSGSYTPPSHREGGRGEHLSQGIALDRQEMNENIIYDEDWDEGSHGSDESFATVDRSARGDGGIAKAMQRGGRHPFLRAKQSSYPDAVGEVAHESLEEESGGNFHHEVNNMNGRPPNLKIIKRKTKSSKSMVGAEDSEVDEKEKEKEKERGLERHSKNRQDMNGHGRRNNHRYSWDRLEPLQADVVEESFTRSNSPLGRGLPNNVGGGGGGKGPAKIHPTPNRYSDFGGGGGGIGSKFEQQQQQQQQLGAHGVGIGMGVRVSGLGGAGAGRGYSRVAGGAVGQRAAYLNGSEIKERPPALLQPLHHISSSKLSVEESSNNNKHPVRVVPGGRKNSISPLHLNRVSSDEEGFEGDESVDLHHSGGEEDSDASGKLQQLHKKDFHNVHGGQGRVEEDHKDGRKLGGRGAAAGAPIAQQAIGQLRQRLVGPSPPPLPLPGQQPGGLAIGGGGAGAARPLKAKIVNSQRPHKGPARSSSQMEMITPPPAAITDLPVNGQGYSFAQGKAKAGEFLLR